MSGINLLAKLGDQPATTPIPVIAISANALSTEIEYSITSGFFSHLTKPVRITQLLEVLSDALATSKKCANNLSESD